MAPTTPTRSGPSPADQGKLHPAGDGIERRRVKDDLAPLGMVLGPGQAVHKGARQGVDELDVRVAHHKPTGLTGGHRHLHAQLDGGASRGGDRLDARHGLLHLEPTGRRQHAVVAIEPARNRVAAEVDDTATETVQLAQYGVEDHVEHGRKLLGPPLRPELGGQCFSEGRKAGDVGEDRRARNPVGHGQPGRQRPPAVAGYVGFDVVGQRARRRCRPAGTGWCPGRQAPPLHLRTVHRIRSSSRDGSITA